jgi:hypothetical protein
MSALFPPEVGVRADIDHFAREVKHCENDPG